MTIPVARPLSSRASAVLKALDLPTDGQTVQGVYDGSWGGSGPVVETTCPATGEVLARVVTGTAKDTQRAIQRSVEAQRALRAMPGPQRGEVLRQIREVLGEKTQALGDLVTLEMGKIRSEGKGEVQEFVDILDYAVGLSRSMSGRVLPSERPEHVIYEIPNPLGTIAILSAFNFPVAVYGWNLAIAIATGNTTLWKPSPTTPLVSVAVTKLIAPILEKNGLPGSVASLVCGDRDVGETLVASNDIQMVSFTGSEAVGKIVGKNVQDRFGKALLELGGNNAAIVDKDADLDLALQAVVFAAVGTAGQRCTSTRRLYLHRDIASTFLSKLQTAYDSVLKRSGDPLAERTLIGPLHSENSVIAYEKALEGILARGGELLSRKEQTGRIKADQVAGGQFAESEGGHFVWPVVVRPKKDDECWTTETFAPILSVAEFDTVEEAIALNNAVPQGLSSSLFTSNIVNMGKWLGANGSDCGIVNVNVGTSGAEIGAAFGGNKSTGWGRESGGDAWKQYVRWSSATVNYGTKGALAQGVSFD